MHRDFATGNVFPAGWLDALSETLGSYVSRNFSITQASATTVQCVAGTGAAQKAVAIAGQWRYISATITATAPAGAAGTYPIYLTSQVNNSSQEDAGTFNYAFAIKLATAPTGSGAEAISMQVGTYEWDGSKIVLVRGPGTHPQYESHIYTLSGGVQTPTSGVLATPTDGTFLQPYWAHLNTATEQLALRSIYAWCSTGSFTYNVYQKPNAGVEAAILSGQGVNSTESVASFRVALADRDRIRIAIASISSASNATIQVEFERVTLPI